MVAPPPLQREVCKAPSPPAKLRRARSARHDRLIELGGVSRVQVAPARWSSRCECRCWSYCHRQRPHILVGSLRWRLIGVTTPTAPLIFWARPRQMSVCGVGVGGGRVPVGVSVLRGFFGVSVVYVYGSVLVVVRVLVGLGVQLALRRANMNTYQD